MFEEHLIEGDRLDDTGPGIAFRLRLPWYRALPLSTVELARVRVDGWDVAPAALRLELNGRLHAAGELAGLADEWWDVLDSAILHVDLQGAEPGTPHDVEVTLNLHPPYIPGLVWVTTSRKVLQASSGNGVRLGVTLFSLTNAYYSRRYTFEQLLAKVAALGLGPGLEIVGFQSIRGFPRVSDDFAARFAGLMREHGLEPTCLGINADVAIRRDRRMTDDESVAYHEAQVHAAAKLGFPVARYQLGAGPEVVKRLVPLAERVGVKLGLEIHAPQRVDAPDIVAYREMYQKVGSPYLGFIPDFGSCATAVPRGLLERARRRGASEQLIELAVQLWSAPGDPQVKSAAFRQQAAALGAEPATAGALGIIFHILGRMPPASWSEIMPQVVHVHGKFYEIGPEGREPSIPYEDLLPVFRDGGYTGSLSSEWEGHIYSDADGFDEVRAQQALCRRILLEGSSNPEPASPRTSGEYASPRISTHQ